MSQLIFQISELPDLKSQEYTAIHGQETTTHTKDSLDRYKKGLPNYYLPLQLEADENNDMLMACEAISSFNGPVVLQITLEPDTIKEKSSWISTLDQMLSQLPSRGD